jgi:hypothetical protein
MITPASALGRRQFLGLGPALLVAAGMAPNPAMSQTDPLPSWNEGAVKASIVGFVGA